MGGPTIIEFSSNKLQKRRVSPRHETNASSAPPPMAAVAASKKNDTPVSTSPSNDNDDDEEGGFRRTVLVPAVAALIVFITTKQLATSPKVWQIRTTISSSVQQKVQQVKLLYQPVPVRGIGGSTGYESFALAFEQSLGFFDCITDSDWKYRQHWARTRIDHAGSVKSDTDNPKSWYMNNYYPAFSCPGLMRVGRKPGPGPKFVCDPHRLPAVAAQRSNSTTGTASKCLIYSVGNPWNFDFEDGMLQLNGDECEIHVFFEGDMGAQKVNMNFHKWQIKSSGENTAGAKTLQESIKELGHEGRVIDVLKVGECMYLSW